MFDPELYRDKAEVEKWKERDPLVTLPEQMRTAGLLSDDEWKKMNEDAAAEVDEAVAFAEAGTWEPVEELTRFVYSEGTSR
jgi:TPP-dependent pyruvate/acetoin dehydrogenase alpha subunit